MGRNKEISAGLIMWDIEDGVPKILLGKPGGPYFINKHGKVFGIPKGKVEEGESILEGAIREFEEETGLQTKGPYIEMPSVKYNSGKTVHAFAFRSKFSGEIKSNIFKMEWPPHSGKVIDVPELEHAKMFDLDTAIEVIMISQEGFVHSMREYFKSINVL